MAVAYLLDPAKDPDDFVGDDKTSPLNHVKEIGARLGYSNDKLMHAYQEASKFVNQKVDRKQREWPMEGHGMTPLEW
ncbi:hypothetical protein P3T76_013801 [Phytophthora citrophthora]|uniref:Uncharacterized protein n=1 Tax=Phytophthora citrophthora TaxID=4793 RepID=A0AAD9G2K4_9STRA|nr:hypothetical protein P3T76_013801 [Phytophthora citrophthora]